VKFVFVHAVFPGWFNLWSLSRLALNAGLQSAKIVIEGTVLQKQFMALSRTTA
jgi:hypothetical protein